MFSFAFDASKFSIFQAHGHVEVGLVVSSFASGEYANVLPCQPWVYVHLMDFGAHSLVPLSLC